MIEQIKKMLKELALLSGMITKDRDTSVLSFLNVKFQAETNWIFPSNAFAWVRIVQIVQYVLLALKFTIEY